MFSRSSFETYTGMILDEKIFKRKVYSLELKTTMIGYKVYSSTYEN